MTRDELRAVGRRLIDLHRRFAGCFGRKEAQEHALTYLKGLILGDGRKNAERIALRFGATSDGSSAAQKEVVALQEFLRCSPWEAGEVMREVQSVFAEEFVPSAALPLGVVGVIDETSFEKSGPESCGAGQQYCGTLGQPANCQVGVFLLGVTPAGTALLDHELYLPRAWIKDRIRRKKTRVPKEIRFRTKPQIALDQLERTRAAGHVRFDWIVADALYGHDGKFLGGLEQLGERYVVQVQCDARVWPKRFAAEIETWWWDERRPTIKETRQAAKTVQAVAESLPPSAWRVVHLREGEKGPLAFEFARWRVWAIRDKKQGPSLWLLVRRTLGKDPEYKYYLSNADQAMPLETLALVTGTRFQVEQFFEESKGSLGLADYEARGWTSWHHHVSLVALAHLFLMQTRRELRASEPELTLPLALELVRSTIVRPQFNQDDAIHLVQYHLQRNATARASHRKSWLQKNKMKIPKPLL